MAEKFYVTTPIYYVNARPHIGHAYTTIVADVLARRRRLLGEDVFFLTGTDEHGQKIERSAAAACIAPQQFADQVSQSFRDLWQRMGITNDAYIRTTDPAHIRGVQKLFADLYARGKIYLSSYTGQYSIGEEMFVEGPPGTIGPDGKPTETVTEENFFFRLSEYQLALLDLIESGALEITPESRRNEVLSFLRGPVNAPADHKGPAEENSEVVPHSEAQDAQSKDLRFSACGTPYVPGALKDLSVSRSSFTWGIPVPEPAASEAKEKHVIYVWLDALANYMTALGYGADKPEEQSRFNHYWPADLHLVGKEIIRFHCVYWPAFLLAAGLPLPKAVTAHGWLLFEDSKMSKSKGNIVRTETILEAFGALCPPALSDTPAEPTKHDRDLFAADVLRYFLLREIPFGQDGSFSFDAMITRYNADLANGYGNLVSRTLNLIGQNYSEVPGSGLQEVAELSAEPSLEEKASFWCGVVRRGFAEGDQNQTFPIAESWDEFAFEAVLSGLQSQVTRVDSFLTTTKPWYLAKSEEPGARNALSGVLYTAAESIRILTALLYPILPYATGRVWRQLGLGDIEQAAAAGQLANPQWGGLQPGTKLGPLGPIFPRADKGLAQTMADIESRNANPNTPEGANDAADTTTRTRTDFVETPIASDVKKPLSKLVDETTGHTSLVNPAAFDPAAGPRTSSFAEPNPGATVAGSSAITTERAGTPPHSEAQASGIFAGPSDASPQIGIEDFAKIELRVAKILVAERIPKADKLLRLEVDLGYERRQILSGIAEWYTPEDLLGRRIVVITNLAPRKMRGLESHGMLLAASTEGGKPYLASCGESDDLPLGSRLK